MGKNEKKCVKFSKILNFKIFNSLALTNKDVSKINNSNLDQLQKLWTKHKPEDDKVIQLFSDRKKALTERK